MRGRGASPPTASTPRSPSATDEARWVVELRRVEMSEAVWIAIIALLGAVLTPLVVEWYKRRRRRPTTAPRVNVSAPSPALRAESNTPQVPSLSEMPAESNTTETPSATPADSSTPQATREKRAT